MNNLWDLAVEQARQNEKASKRKLDSLMLIIGSKNAGKTSISYKFVEKSDVPKPSITLEYSFARKSKGIGVEKDLCHIWELGGGTVFQELLQIPMTAKNLPFLIVVLVLDLSALDELWFTMEVLLTAVKKQVERVLKESRDTDLKDLMDENRKRFSNMENVDEKLADPFPVPLLIIGSKFDLFQEVESEKRKFICKCLRYVALINGAALIFTSSRTEGLMNKARVLLSHLVFGTAASKTPVLDYNKPLYVPFGSDSVQSIGSLPDPQKPSVSLKVRSLDMVKQCFISFFPQIESKNVIPEDPGSDPNFKEPEIDLLRDQKDRELEEFIKHRRKKEKIWDQDL